MIEKKKNAKKRKIKAMKVELKQIIDELADANNLPKWQIDKTVGWTIAELQEWLIKNKILVLVDYCYECTNTSYFYKIYKFVDEHGKCEKWPVKGVRYDNKGTEIEETVCYRDYKRSCSDYETYSDALEAGLYEALTMLETKTIDVTEERNINIKNGVYIENNTGIINI